ncbi:MAG: hypothetical protein ACFFE4_10735 [Candidatus Thorarchaeota archaeon]
MYEINLEELKNEIPHIFVKVKRDVRKVTGRHRAGLSLGLVEMGMYQGGFIGGMHFAPGTDIVMNKTPLKILLEQQTDEIIWAYTYHILLHEYIHSLGELDERKCRIITLAVSEEIFKETSHPAVILANNGIGTYFPNLKLIYSPPDLKPDGIPIEYIKYFDKESYEHYS